LLPAILPGELTLLAAQEVDLSQLSQPLVLRQAGTAPVLVEEAQLLAMPLETLSFLELVAQQTEPPLPPLQFQDFVVMALLPP
jgi:hypothetical protein